MNSESIISKNHNVELLEKIKECIIKRDDSNGKIFTEQYQKLSQVTTDKKHHLYELLIHFKLYDILEKLFGLNEDYYLLGKWYLSTRNFKDAKEAFQNWAKKYNDLGQDTLFNVTILFAEKNYSKLLEYINKIILDSPENLNWLFNSIGYENIEYTDEERKRERKRNFIKWLTNTQYQAIISSFIKHYQISEVHEFDKLLRSKYKGLLELIEYKLGVQNTFAKFKDGVTEEKIDKLINKLLSRFNSLPPDPLGTIESLINLERVNNDFDKLIVLNDPIMTEVINSFEKYNETKKGFKEFENIVLDNLSKCNDYIEKYDLGGLIAYHILVKNFVEALKLIRLKKGNIYPDFELLINLILNSNTDINAEDIITYRYFFFGEYYKPFSEYVNKTLPEFVAFINKRIDEIRFKEQTLFINLFKDNFIPYHSGFSRMPTGIYYYYKNIFNTSPLGKSIINNEISMVTYTQTEPAIKLFTKYFSNIENEYREFNGVNKVGIASEYEALVYHFLKKELSNDEIVLQYSPIWLSPQRVDFYIPRLNLAIEFQGEQHFKPIEFWGGEKGLEESTERDVKKRNLLLINKVNFEYITYKDDIQCKVNEIIKKYI